MKIKESIRDWLVVIFFLIIFVIVSYYLPLIDMATAIGVTTITPSSLVLYEDGAFNCFATGGTAPYVYEWDFGDGTAVVIQNTTHAYTKWNCYTVYLNVTDATGAYVNQSVKCCVYPKKTTSTISSIDETPYNTLIEALTGTNSTGHINESEMPNFVNYTTGISTPFTAIFGSLFYVMFFGLFFMMMWIRQAKVTIPLVLAIIVGGSLLAYAAPEYRMPVVLLIALGIFGAIYVFLKERK